MTAKGTVLVHYDEAKAAEMYKKGRSLASLARHFEVSSATIRKRLIKRGVKMRKGPPPRHYDWDGIAADYESGLSAAKVARKHHTSTRKVMAEVRRRGLEIHKPGERPGAKAKREAKAHCKRCDILLEVVAYHKDGLCCICLADDKGTETGLWIWADCDGYGS